MVVSVTMGLELRAADVEAVAVVPPLVDTILNASPPLVVATVSVLAIAPTLSSSALLIKSMLITR